MKKIILSLIVLIGFGGLFAQKSNISKAKNRAQSETPDFAGAREAIKLALKDSTTKNLAETWYVAGMIGYLENEQLYKKYLTNQSYDADVKGRAILESYNYFLEALKLDSLPDKKGKVKIKFTKEIKPKIIDYYKVPGNLWNYGATLFSKKDYENAMKVFDTYLAIPKLSIVNNEIPIDSNYYKVEFYNAYASSLSKNHEKAIKLYEDLKDKNYETLTVYQFLYKEYQTINDTINFVKILQEGCTKFPTDSWFLQSLINYYVYSGKVKDALVYINTAIQREPNVAQYYYAKGTMEESINNTAEALTSFNKALELNPNLPEAYAGKGRLYFNKAVKASDDIESIKDIKKYNAEKKKVDDMFKDCIPYFQKACELKPSDKEYKTTLRTLYYRLQKDPVYMKKYDEINKEIQNMN